MTIPDNKPQPDKQVPQEASKSAQGAWQTYFMPLGNGRWRIVAKRVEKQAK